MLQFNLVWRNLCTCGILNLKNACCLICCLRVIYEMCQLANANTEMVIFKTFHDKVAGFCSYYRRLHRFPHLSLTLNVTYRPATGANAEAPRYSGVPRSHLTPTFLTSQEAEPSRAQSLACRRGPPVVREAAQARNAGRRGLEEGEARDADTGRVRR